MSTTVREEYEVGDLDPAGVLEAAADSRTEPNDEPRSASSSSPPTGPTSTPPPPTPVSRRSVARPSWPTSHSAATAHRPVAAFTPEPFALALGMSPSAGAQLIADALDLRHRLPMLWKRVGRLEVPAWQARRVARQTHRLPKAAAIWVDEQLADRGTCGPVIVDRLVAHAIAAYDPEDTRRPRERRPGRLGRHPHPPRGHRLPRHLPPRSHRRHPGPQGVLRPGLCASPTSCSSTATPHRSASARSRPSASSPANPRPPGKPKVKVYARVDARDLETRRPRRRRDREARRRHPHQDPHLGRPPPSRHPTRPEHGPPRRRRLPRPTRLDARPRPPPRRPLHLPQMPGRRPVLRPRPHRSPTTRTDHPAKPRPANLACLCRRHHRAKTTGRWRYLRTPDGDYQWHGPYGTTYLVTDHGTRRLPQPPAPTQPGSGVRPM